MEAALDLGDLWIAEGNRGLWKPLGSIVWFWFMISAWKAL